MTTAIQGLRGTGQFSTDFRPTNYRELYTMLEPNGDAPLQALLAMTASEATDDPKFNHFRDELPARFLTSSAGDLVGATTLTVNSSTDIGFFVINSVVRNMRTNELMLVTANASGTSLAVTRGVAGTTAAAILTNDVLALVGHAATEGSGKPTAVMWDATTDFNYTQIFKQGVNITGTMQETYLRTGSKEREAVEKALKLHMADIERTFFFGARHIENGSSANPRRYTGGLFSLLSSRVTDAASGFTTANTITENEFDRLLIETIFAWGSKEKIAFAGPRVISNLQRIAKARWQPTAVSGSYGVGLTRYSTFAGDLMVHLHPLFRQIPGLDHTMVILDLSWLKYRYMKNRDTQLKRNVHTPDTDGVEHYYQTECGLDLRQVKPHAIVRNWQAV